MYFNLLYLSSILKGIFLELSIKQFNRQRKYSFTNLLLGLGTINSIEGVRGGG